MNSTNPSVKTLVYVAGYGRSGSTIFDTYIGNKHACFGAGELTNIFRETIKKKKCSCSSTIRNCPVWGSVLPPTEEELAEYSQITLENEKLLSTRRSPEKYLKVWSPLFAKLYETNDVIVDSSKISRFCFFRIALISLMGYQVKLVYLYKDPRDLIISLRKGSNNALEKKSQSNRKASATFLIKSTIGWTIAMIGTSVLAKRLSTPVVSINLDNFTEDPESICRQLLGIESPEQTVLSSGHGISGNRTRKTSREIRVEKRNSSVQSFGPLERFLIFYMTTLNKLLKGKHL